MSSGFRWEVGGGGGWEAAGYTGGLNRWRGAGPVSVFGGARGHQSDVRPF